MTEFSDTLATPRRPENNAEQAVRAALEIIEMAAKFEVPGSGQLRVQIGISSGLAVVGDPSGEGTRLEQGAVGETLHLAARLQAVASPNEIVIANSTRRLTGSLFRYRDLGKLTLKGFVEPVQVWRVLSRARSQSVQGTAQPAPH